MGLGSSVSDRDGDFFSDFWDPDRFLDFLELFRPTVSSQLVLECTPPKPGITEIAPPNPCSGLPRAVCFVLGVLPPEPIVAT